MFHVKRPACVFGLFDVCLPFMTRSDRTTDTIYALSSAPGKAGVAVVRVSGEQAGLALQTIAGHLPKARTAALRDLRRPAPMRTQGSLSPMAKSAASAVISPRNSSKKLDVDPNWLTGELIDRALVLWFPAPRSFTGEASAEFHVHGGKAVLAALFDALALIPGCRPAEPGEFARRAFANGKLDLTQAEGLADLIDAETEVQRRQAVNQADGALHRLYERWRQDIIQCLALQEAGIDFSDEQDVAEQAADSTRQGVSALREALISHLNDANRGEILRDGFQVVLAGPPNAGKSSLLNALARRDVAIVSGQAGTTRDVIEVRLDLKGLPIVISDTAGIRDAAAAIEEIESIGIERSKARARTADLVLWLNDLNEPPIVPPEGFTIDAGGRASAALLIVGTKADLLDQVGGSAESGPDALSRPREIDKRKSTRQDGSGSSRSNILNDGAVISVVSGAGLLELTQQIADFAADRLANQAGPALTQIRHRQNLEQSLKWLGIYLDGSTADPELRAEELRQAALALGRITGHVDVEDVLGKIFSSFCIGK